MSDLHSNPQAALAEHVITATARQWAAIGARQQAAAETQRARAAAQAEVAQARAERDALREAHAADDAATAAWQRLNHLQAGDS